MNHKESFLKEHYLDHIRNLDPETGNKWGKMNVHQMIEHMTDAFRMGNGRDLYTGILTPEERLEKAQAFVLSDLPFKENTKNLLMGEEPFPLRHADLADSIAELETEVLHFFDVWEKQPEQTIRNPFFGDLDYPHWIGLLYKHCWHHLNQFGVMQA